MKRERPIQKLIRMTEDEENFIIDKMRSSNIKKFQHFALMMLIQGEVTFVDYSELRQLVYEVKKIGTNVNQVVKLAHQFSDISAIDIQQLTQSLDTLAHLVESELTTQRKSYEKGDTA